MQNTTKTDAPEPEATRKNENGDPHPGAKSPSPDAIAEVRVLGDEVFQQPIESLIRTSADTNRAVFLSGTFGGTMPYLIVCLAGGEAASIKVAQMLVEDLICGDEAPAAHPGLRQKAWRKYRGYRKASAAPNDQA